jgi:hypothetical protein
VAITDLSVMANPFVWRAIRRGDTGPSSAEASIQLLRWPTRGKKWTRRHAARDRVRLLAVHVLRFHRRSPADVRFSQESLREPTLSAGASQHVVVDCHGTEGRTRRLAGLNGYVMRVQSCPEKNDDADQIRGCHVFDPRACWMRDVAVDPAS